MAALRLSLTASLSTCDANHETLITDAVVAIGMVNSLWRHFAAADLAVVKAVGTTTLELEVLRTPFLYFPVEGHPEQQVTVAGRLARHGAGVRMQPSTSTPTSLAEAIVAHLGESVAYPPVAAYGAGRAAARILERAGIQPDVTA
jgi:UDP-N-acetylglucosamine:LPS N-acetylglucosamine transferase